MPFSLFLHNPFERSWNMGIRYEVISEDEIICIKDLCNELMAYQKSKASDPSGVV